MLAHFAAHDKWLGQKHEYSGIHSVLAVSHRAGAFDAAELLRAAISTCTTKGIEPVTSINASSTTPPRRGAGIGHRCHARPGIGCLGLAALEIEAVTLCPVRRDE